MSNTKIPHPDERAKAPSDLYLDRRAELLEGQGRLLVDALDRLNVDDEGVWHVARDLETTAEMVSALVAGRELSTAELTHVLKVTTRAMAGAARQLDALWCLELARSHAGAEALDEEAARPPASAVQSKGGRRAA
jgi:hypothetical protein